MTMPQKIIVLTAVYNDWESFKLLLSELELELADRPYEIEVVVVDDGSPTFADEYDFSGLKLSAISRVNVVTMTRNLGNQRALAIGLGYISKNLSCDYLVIMDSDLEDRPEFIPTLIDKAQVSGNKIIFAERTRRPEGSVFKLLYRAYKGLYKMLTGMSISVGNFSVIPRRLIKRVAGISEIWNHFPAGIMRGRIPFLTIPSYRGTRVHGASKMNLVALVIHGLSGLAAHADVVVVRAFLGIMSMGIGIMALMAFLLFQNLPIASAQIDQTYQIVAVLGSALLQMFIAGVIIVFLVLVGRHQKLIVPAVDFEDFILEISLLMEKDEN